MREIMKILGQIWDLTIAKKMNTFSHLWLNRIIFAPFIFTWNCASSKDIEAVQQNCEVDLKTHWIFLYGELLEDLSLE